MQRRLVSGLLVIVVLLLAGCVTDQAVVDVDEIYKNLLCTCGCTMPLNTCECGTAAQMQSEIGGMVDRGMTKQLILDAYVERHGQVILTSPPKAGFSLMAWVTPFLALAAGAVVLYAASGCGSSRVRYASTPRRKPG